MWILNNYRNMYGGSLKLIFNDFLLLLLLLLEVFFLYRKIVSEILILFLIKVRDIVS